MSFALDASTLLAVFNEEPGFEAAEALHPGSLVTAVNLCEVFTKAVERRVPVAEVEEWLRYSQVTVVPFGRDLAIRTAELRPSTRSLGLSLGDRACLAMALRRQLPVLTADRAWQQLAQALGVEIRLFR
jgi:PIN domain nuclease of toxin-antitoxin system